MFQVLEAFERGEITRLIVEAPPRHSKTECFSRRLSSFAMGRTPGLQFVSSTYNQDFANDIGREVKQIVQSDAYGQVFNGVTLRKDSKAADRFHLTNGSQYVSVGTGSALTGRGMDIGAVDDYTKDREDADSERKRNVNWNWFRSTFYTRQMPKARLLVGATRWHEDDLIGRLMEQEGDAWYRLRLKAIKNEGQPNEEALWPEWYPLKTLKDIRKMIGVREWLSLYQQSPTAEDGTIFERRWFEDNMYDPADLPDPLNYYVTGDFAAAADSRDNTVLILWGLDNKGILYAVNCWYAKGAASNVWIETLIDMIDSRPVLGFIGESGPIRAAIEPMLKRRMREREIFTKLSWLPHTAGNKVALSRSFQAMAGLNRVRFPKGASWAEQIIDELLKFPSGKMDDMVDTCSLMGRFLSKSMNAHVPVHKSNANKHLPDQSRILRISNFLPKRRLGSKRSGKLYLK